MFDFYYRIKRLHFKWWFHTNIVKRLHRVVFTPELWNLDDTMTNFILPRLKLFKASLHGHPCNLTETEWNGILDKMIDAFTLMNKNDRDFTSAEQVVINQGLELFAKYYQDLWD